MHGASYLISIPLIKCVLSEMSLISFICYCTFLIEFTLFNKLPSEVLTYAFWSLRLVTSSYNRLESLLHFPIHSFSPIPLWGMGSFNVEFWILKRLQVSDVRENFASQRKIGWEPIAEVFSTSPSLIKNNWVQIKLIWDSRWIAQDKIYWIHLR